MQGKVKTGSKAFTLCNLAEETQQAPKETASKGTFSYFITPTAVLLQTNFS